MEHDPDWPIKMTAQIGERVAAFREGKQPKMTVQALADKCAELGVPLGRVTITKLERGMRQTITPAEVTVLAAALEVSPLELLYPLGFAERVELLPGFEVDPLAAVRWFCGEMTLVAAHGAATLRMPGPEEESGIRLLQTHNELIERLAARERAASVMATRAAHPGANEQSRRDAGDSLTVAEEWREFIREPLRLTRAEMRRRGMLVPSLPPDLQLDDVDGESDR